MKIREITESTVSGSIAPVSAPLGGTRHRTDTQSVYSGGKVGSLLKGKQTSKKFANSVHESQSLNEPLQEKAKSKAQQKFFGMADAIQKGEKVPNASPALKKVAKTVSHKAVKDFASTKLKGLPKHVSEAELQEDDIIQVPGGRRHGQNLLSKPEVSINPTDSVTVDIPLLIRLLEYAREDAAGDIDLHRVAERLTALSARGRVLKMRDYERIVGESVGGAVGGAVGALVGSGLGPVGSMVGGEIGARAGDKLARESRHR